MIVRVALVSLLLSGCQGLVRHHDEAGASGAAPATSASTATPAKTYAIKLGRPDKVGAASHVIVDDEHSEHTVAGLAGGATRKDKTVTGSDHIEGVVTVLELQPAGASLREDMVVRDFWSIDPTGAKTVLAPAGAHLAITRAAKKEDARVTVDGRAASKAVRAALDRLTSLTLHKGPSDDQVFGTAAPQPIGGEWDVDAPLAEKDLGARGMAIAPGSVSGKAKLVSVQAVNGVDCLEVDVHITVSSIEKLKELPPGSTVEDGRIDMHMHTMLPIDVTQTAPQADMDLAVSGHFTVPSRLGSVVVTLDTADHKRGRSVP